MATKNAKYTPARTAQPCPDCGQPLIRFDGSDSFFACPTCIKAAGRAPVLVPAPAEPAARPAYRLDLSVLTPKALARARELAKEEGQPAEEVIHRFARREGQRRSVAERELVLIVKLAQLVQQLADRWVNEHQATDCPCDVCRSGENDDAGYILDDLRALAWATNQAGGSVRNYTATYFEDLELGGLVEALSVLSAEGEVIDRMRGEGANRDGADNDQEGEEEVTTAAVVAAKG